MSKKDFKKRSSELFSNTKKRGEAPPLDIDSKRKGTKPNELRHTFLIKEDTLAKLKEISKQRDVFLKSIVNQALERYIEDWEERHGGLKYIKYEGKRDREARIAKELEKIKSELH